MNYEERLRSDGYDPSEVIPLLFFNPAHAHGCLSQWSRHGIRATHPWTGETTWYPTVEHYYQAAKATTLEAYEYVLAAEDARQAKERGHEIELRADWGETEAGVCFAFMLAGCRAKAAQHACVREVLHTSGDRPIYEDSHTDDIWGWRHHGDYRGRNLLGKCWMLVRAELSTGFHVVDEVRRPVARVGTLIEALKKCGGHPRWRIWDYERRRYATEADLDILPATCDDPQVASPNPTGGLKCSP